MSEWKKPGAVARLHALLEKGASAETIATLLRADGVQVSRAAVISRVKREGLKLRREPWRPSVTPASSPVEVPTDFKGLPIAPAGAPAQVRKSGRRKAPSGLRLINAGYGVCRWPVGGTGVDLLVCGAPAQEGRPYCAGHMRIAYTPVSWSPRLPSDRSVGRYRPRDADEADLVSLIGEDV